MHIYIYIYIYIHALWRRLMRAEYFLVVHHTISILGKLSTWCFEHSGDISCSLYSLTQAPVMSPGKDETRVCGNIYIYIYIYITNYSK